MKQKSPINSYTLLQRNPEQLFSVIDQEVVMLNIQHEEYLNLNQHASYIWQKLETPRSFGELIALLCNAYEVEEQVCRQDTLDFISELIEKGIIQIIHEETA